MIRPQQKKMKLQRALIESVKAGDEVVLNSGIFGVISEVEGDVVWLEVAGDLELKVFSEQHHLLFHDLPITNHNRILSSGNRIP